MEWVAKKKADWFRFVRNLFVTGIFGNNCITFTDCLVISSGSKKTYDGLHYSFLSDMFDQVVY